MLKYKMKLPSVKSDRYGISRLTSEAKKRAGVGVGSYTITRRVHAMRS